jgi:Uma2 family endonuclease
MVATAIKENKIWAKPNGHSSKPISWEVFEKKYLSREDSYTYEWVNGLVVKTKRAMDSKQFAIEENLLDVFYKLKFAGKFSGQLITEGDIRFLENHRRPDMAYFTKPQIAELAKGSRKEIPQFVIEVISTTDEMNRVYEKMQDYERAEVKVIWHVFAKLQEVHVYHGRQSRIYRGDELVSASPVLSDFEMCVSDIFKIHE